MCIFDISKTIKHMTTINDIKNARPNKDLIFLRRDLEKLLENCRTVKEFDKYQKMINIIDDKFKH